MRKVVAILLAGVLTLGASMTAFAAGSVSATEDVSKNASAVSSSDSNVTVGAVEADSEGYDAAAAILADSTNAELAKYVSNADDYTLTYLVDVEVNADAVTDGSYTVTLQVAGVTASSTVVVLHYVNGAWEYVAATAGEDTVTFTLTSFSPIAIYVLDEESGSTTTTESTSSTSTTSTSSTSDDSDDDETTSDETGEVNVMLYVMMVAVAAAAGMAVSGKKRRA